MRSILSTLLILMAVFRMAACHGEEEHDHEKHEHGADEEGEHDDDHEKDDHKEGEHRNEDTVTLSPEALAHNTVETAKAEVRDLPHILQLTGELKYPPRSVSHTAPRLDGQISEVHVRLGQIVKAGVPLATVRSAKLAELSIGFISSKTRYRLLLGNRKRLRKLRKEQLARASELTAAETAAAMARADMMAFREKLHVAGLSYEDIDALKFGASDLAKMIVPAPKNGRVITLDASPGEYVSPESPIAVIANDRSLDMWVHVSSRDVAHLHEGNKATVTTPAWPGRSFPGTLDYLGHKVDGSRLLRARIQIPNSEGLLRPGMLVTSQVVETEPEESGEVDRDHAAHHALGQLAVPSAAVRRDSGGSHVWVEERPGTYRKVKVVVGRRGPMWTAIEKGIEAGMKVVTRGAFLVGAESKKSSLGHGHAH